MKKLLKAAILLCFFLIAFSAGAVAPKAHAQIASGTIGNTVLSWSLEDNGDLTIRTNYEGQKGYIPDYPSNSTADFRQYKDQIKRIIWTKGVSVTSIGERAFEDCVNLESMEIPADVASVGAYAFQGCTRLASVTFSSEKYSTFAAATEISIGNRAFGNCPALGTVSMQNTVTSVSSTAFTGSDNAKIHVPDYNGAAARAVSNATHFYVGSDTAWGIRYYGDVLNLRKYTGTAASASLPAYVTAIYSDTAFTGSALKALTVTDSLASVGAYQGFGYAEGALRIYVPTPTGSAARAVCNAYGNQLKVYFVIGTDMALQYNSSEGVVTLRAYTGSAENVVIPAYIDAIYEYAFSGSHDENRDHDFGEEYGQKRLLGLRRAGNGDPGRGTDGNPDTGFLQLRESDKCQHPVLRDQYQHFGFQRLYKPALPDADRQCDRNRPLRHVPG